MFGDKISTEHTINKNSTRIILFFYTGDFLSWVLLHKVIYNRKWFSKYSSTAVQGQMLSDSCFSLSSQAPCICEAPWNKMALAQTIPISMLVSFLFCLSGVTGKFERSAALNLPGEEVTQDCDHANSPSWKIQESKWQALVCVNTDRRREERHIPGKKDREIKKEQNMTLRGELGKQCLRLLPQVKWG